MIAAAIDKRTIHWCGLEKKCVARAMGSSSVGANAGASRLAKTMMMVMELNRAGLPASGARICMKSTENACFLRHLEVMKMYFLVKSCIFSIHVFFDASWCFFMQIFCKKLSVALGFCMVLCISVLLTACFGDDESSKKVVLYPDIAPVFSIYPNDQAPNDSIAANLAHGISLIVHPLAEYRLSFDEDPSFEPPVLQLFRVNKNNRFRQVRSLKAERSGGRLVYRFVCEESAATKWVTTLEQFGTFYKGKISNVRFEGDGAYSSELSLNLIAVGNVEEDLDSISLRKFGDELLAAFRYYYTSIKIDTLYVNYAHEHPTLGRNYPANLPWVADYGSENMMLSELGDWPGIEKALDIVLVHAISSEGILGTSSLFGGSLSGGAASTVLLGTSVIGPYNTEFHETVESIIETAVHETGHYFGLRHTTSTKADMQQVFYGVDYGDYSNIEDGLEDTPFCSELFKSGLLKLAKSVNSDIIFYPPLRETNLSLRTLEDVTADCPDADNLMFPTTVKNRSLKFSDQQLQLIRKNLMIFPH